MPARSVYISSWYFYPRPPRGGRHVGPNEAVAPPTISIHALREEGDNEHSGLQHHPHHFYPRPPRGGRQITYWDNYNQNLISIHALREEGDQDELFTGPTLQNFYPRPPRGGRPRALPTLRTTMLFLSTPSARRATPLPRRFLRAAGISIHALREEGDGRVRWPQNFP